MTMIVIKSGAINSMGRTKFIEKKRSMKLVPSSYLKEMSFELSLEQWGGLS